MSNTNEVKEFSVQGLLGSGNNYLVPMYQRNYSWGEGQITQLVRDIADSMTANNYYIGTLIVYRREDGHLEVIDGQQRFTTLSLLISAIKNQAVEYKRTKTAIKVTTWYKSPNIKFESRYKSQATFTAISEGLPLKKLQSDEKNEFNEDLVSGYDLCLKALAELRDVKITEFANYLLNHVKIMQVEVPDDTDLNHYFEIMNSRGEQLEKHEVLKAELMSVLQSKLRGAKREKALYTLNRVWEACANMERYVQYEFTVAERHKIFGKNDWGRFTVDNFNALSDALDTDDKIATRLSISEILDNRSQSDNSFLKDEADKLEEDRFSSVINFSNFLLHVLRVYCGEDWYDRGEEQGLSSDEKGSDISLDDKNLIKTFQNKLLDAFAKPEQAVMGFVHCILKCRYLFDQFVIKRELSTANDGWSLKKLKYYNKKSVSFINTFDSNDNSFDSVNRDILMLLSAFHVSTPTLAYKHWLTAVLYYLSGQKEVDAENYLKYLNNLAKRYIFNLFLIKGNGENYADIIFRYKHSYTPENVEYEDVDESKLTYRSIRNIFVFNYLDYLLWKKRKGSKNKKIQEFEFTFRSSIEHFYPQHPMGDFDKLPEGDLHQFGNLCLISHGKNSRLSNMPPAEKREYLEMLLKKEKVESLKLYKMMEMTVDEKSWGKEQIQKHGEEMIELLLSSTES